MTEINYLSAQCQLIQQIINKLFNIKHQKNHEKSTCQHHMILELLGAPCNANTRNFRRKALKLRRCDMLTLSHCAKTQRRTTYAKKNSPEKKGWYCMYIIFHGFKSMHYNITNKEYVPNESLSLGGASQRKPRSQHWLLLGWQNCTSWHRIIHAKRICVRGSWCTLPWKLTWQWKNTHLKMYLYLLLKMVDFPLSC